MPILGIIASSIQKAFSTFSDTFNRTTSGSLGTSSSGGLWKALKGVFFANGNAAKSDDAATSYPISYVDMTKADVTASITTGSLVTISTGGTVGSISSNTVGGATFYTATITGMSSTTGMAAGQRIVATNGTGSLFGGSPDFVEITNVVSGTSITYRTKNGTTPTAGSVTSIQTANNDGGSGIALWITDSGNWWGVSYGRSIDTSCNCQTCNVCTAYSSGTAWSCTGWGITGYTCSTFSGPTYSCSTFSSNIDCPTYSYTTFCVAFSSPGNCVAGYGYTTFCSSGWTATYSCSAYSGPTYSCSGSSAVYGCNSWSTSTVWSCSTFGFATCNCQTCYPPYIRFFKSVSNAVSEVTRWTLTAMAAAFKVITTSATKTVTIRPYKDVSMTTQIGSDLTRTESTATMEAKFGIVLGPSDYVQGSTLDDFNITSN